MSTKIDIGKKKVENKCGMLFTEHQVKEQSWEGSWEVRKANGKVPTPTYG